MHRHGPLRHTTLFVAAVLFVCLAPGVEAQEPGPEAFGIDDAIDLTRVSDPQLSPDGLRILFTRTELEWEENERPSRLWMANSDGSDARPYTSEEGDGNAQWSPDGRWVSFLRTVEGADGGRQIFLIRTDGGEARQLTEHPTPIQSYSWTPDGEGLVFVAPDSLPDDEQEELEKGDDAVFVDEGPHGQERGQWTNLWRVDADPDGAQAYPVTEGERRVGEFAVAPDGERVAFTYRTENHRNAQYRSEIALVELGGGGEIEDLTDNNAPESRVRWSPDGGTLTFVAPDLEEWELAQGNLYALELDNRQLTELATDFTGQIRDYKWAPDGESIDLYALHRTDVALFRLDVESDELRRVGQEAGVTSDVSFSADHGWAAFVHSSPGTAGDIYVMDFPDGEATRITEANPWLADRELADPELVTWESEDGLEIEGILYRPPQREDGPGPMVLQIHGGPAAAFTRSFDTDAQILTAYGYAVLQPNVRGSTGYGDDFVRGNMYDIGGGDYEDLMTGVDAMIDDGVAHPDSLAVRGWSYGGILGGWTITRTDRFQAASLGAMVADWRSEFGAGFHHDVVRWYIGGDPWSEREAWIERSPYTHLDRITTPTILFHGDEDRVDTVQQSLNFHEGLRHHDVPTRFLRFPREGHGIQEPRHRRTLLVEDVRWLEQWVREDEDWEAPERPDEPAGESVADDAEEDPTNEG